MQFETQLKKFVETGNISDAVSFLRDCRNNSLFSIGVCIGKYLNDVFPQSSEIIIETALMAYKTNDFECCFNLLQQLDYFLNVNAMNVQIQNIKMGCVPKIKNRYIENHNYEFKNKDKDVKLITFSITTCKRFDLFEKTMNSFLNCCTDVHMIDHWLCVDDNSSEEDRIKMKQKFPFFEFIFKNNKDKGHSRSMNIIYQKLKTPFLFHMEDDWQFFHKSNYMTQCLDVLCQSDNIGQCLINKNYSETEKDFVILGGKKAMSEKGNVFFIHEYCVTDEQKDDFIIRNGSGMNCHYWPHFSFRPSMIKRVVFEKIGAFNEQAEHFEMEYAYRYVKTFVSAFLPSIHCLHIGRLTSERFDKTKLNAYDLNSEAQFVKKEEKKIEEVIERFNFDTFVINLNTRQDRWNQIKNIEELTFLNFQRFEAIDGTKLVPNEKLQRIFDGNDYNMRQGMVGCALSHIQLYVNLINSDKDFYCILEDDLRVSDNFKEKFDLIINNLPENWDLCYLSYHLWKKYRTNEFLNKAELPSLVKWNTEQSLTHSMGGTCAYLISKKGALRALEFLNSTGMINGIDTMQQKMADKLNIYYCKPQIIFSECCDMNDDKMYKKVDTDIQYNFNSLSLLSNARIRNELSYYNENNRDVDVLNLEYTRKAITDPNYSNIIMCLEKNDYKYESSNCIFPFYILGKNIFVAIPKATSKMIEEKCFEKLRKNNKFSIEDALIYKNEEVKDENKEVVQNKVIKEGRIENEKKDNEPVKQVQTKKEKYFISLSDSKHIPEIVSKKYKSNPEFPFDTIDELSLESCLNIMKRILPMTNDDELSNFVEEMFNLDEEKKNGFFGSSHLGFQMFHNDFYKIRFPHERYEDIKKIYLTRFKCLVNTIKNENNYLVFIHASRYEKEKQNIFDSICDLISKYNKNFEIVVINSLDSFNLNSKIRIYTIDFPVNLRTTEWTNEKINYDQTIFRKNLETLLTSLI